MNRKRALWAWVGAIVIVALAIGWTLWPMSQRGATPATARAEPAAQPAVGASRDTLRYPEGATQLTMIASRTIAASPVPLADALSARVTYDEDVTARIGVGLTGRLLALKASAGDTVKVGQVLAEIDSPDVGSALADLQRARADQDRKRLVLARAKDLAEGEAIAAKDLEAALADESQARAETARAELRLQNLNPHGLTVKGQRLSLASPIAGVVAERTANPSMEVNPSLAAPLFVVTDPKRLWLLIDVPEKLLGRMKLGSAVKVESDAFPDESFDATVVQLGQVVDPNTRRVAIRARVANTGARLLPEMFVRASILQESGQGVRVPNGALVNRGMYAYVFVQPTPGVFQRRQVKLLSRGSDSSFVGEGLSGGENIVTSGALLLDAELSARSGDRS